MYGVWTSVKLKREGDARDGTAGVVQATNPADPEQVAVRWDADLLVELVPVAELVQLS